MDEKDEVLVLREQIRQLKKENRELTSKLNLAETSKEEAEANLQRIKGSLGWKLLKPARVVHFAFVRLGHYRTPAKIAARMRYKKLEKKSYELLGTGSFPNAEERAKQESTAFERDIVFSILVPLYNTPETYLRDMIDSVVAQTYAKWELCLADGSDAEHDYVGRICEEYASKDKRIRYQKLASNEGISGNTNACYRMATGEYIGLFDHDDILHPCAFYEYRKVIEEKGADYVYCDEVTFTGDSINNMITLHFKPDYALDTLRANNYICHFSLFAKSLLAETELFRTAFDGSQDHDMILRLTTLAKNVVHVPKVLYYWRAHPGSVASDINAKLYAVDAAKRAVEDHLSHYGIYNTTITSTRAFETIFRLQYDITTEGKVSVILPVDIGTNSWKECLDTLIKREDIQSEILLVTSNPERDDIKEACKNPIVRVVSPKADEAGSMPEEANYNIPAFYNAGAAEATGEYLFFVHPDVKVRTDDFIKELLMFVQRDDVGAAGGKMLFADKTVQHAGVVIGIGEKHVAGCVHYKMEYSHIGYMGRLCYAQNMSAVTGSAMLVKKVDYEKAGGFDISFPTYYDVDFCLKLRTQKKLNVFTPFAEAFFEHVPFAPASNKDEDKENFEKESEAFREKWKSMLEAGDPYYNPNFSINKLDFSLKCIE